MKHRLLLGMVLLLSSAPIVVSGHAWGLAGLLTGGQIPLPSGAVFDGRGQATDGIKWERYKTTRGGIKQFYQKTLAQEGWILVAPLGPEDATDCGGDWGGTYEKGGARFKLHVCGFDQNGASTDITFKFLGKLSPFAGGAEKGSGR